MEDTIDMLAAERVKQLMDAGEKLTFIDLRPAKEFQQTASARRALHSDRRNGQPIQ